MWELPAEGDLSENQREVIRLGLDQSHLVTGPPGSGKSVMAIMRTQALSNDGQPTMLLMYNKLLSLYIKGALVHLGLDRSLVSNYHKWFPKWFRRCYGVEPPMVSPFEFDWTRCLEIAGQNPPPEELREHVLVDEGQDMPRSFYAFLALTTRNMTVFADEYQTLTETNSTVAEILAVTGITSTRSLETNYRNTRAINRVSGHFWTGVGSAPTQLTDSAEDGDKPVLDHDPNLNAVINRIVRFEQPRRNQQIGVLLPYADLVKKFYNRLDNKTANPVQMYLSDMPPGKRLVDFSTNGVKVITWASAKGLEFDTVFLPELQSYKNFDSAADLFRKKMYVLTSRAKRELFFLYSGEGEPPILDALPLEDLDDWR